MATYTLSLHANDGSETTKEENVIYDSAKQYKNHLKIPKNRRFTNRPAEFNKFTKIDTGALANVKLSDKLMVFAHGSDFQLGPYNSIQAGDFNAKAFAKDLVAWGLKECGAITFKSCNIGKAYFMEFLLDELTRVHKVPIGWLKGYVGAASTWKTFGLFGPPTEVIKHHTPDTADDKKPGTKKKYRVVVFKGPEFDNPKIPTLKTHGAFYVEDDSD